MVYPNTQNSVFPKHVKDFSPNPLLTAREYDSESQSYYYRARQYNPSTGRFNRRDSIGYNGGLNLYSYVLNNPVIWVDPFGKLVKATIDTDKCLITLTLNITIYAQDDDTKPKIKWDSLVLRIEDAIETHWNKGNWKIDNCDIRFVANVKADKVSTTYAGAEDDNEIQINDEKADEFDSNVSGSDSGGTWSQKEDDWVFAHEAGHLMGLPDDYTETYENRKYFFVYPLWRNANNYA